MDVPIEIQKIIGPKETIEVFVDADAYPQITIDTVAVTSERIIMLRPSGSGPKTEPVVYKFLDIAGVGVEKGFMRSILRLRLNGTGETMGSVRLPTKTADEVLKYLKEKVCGIRSPF